jgi:predicted AAA+ superfamily ATPase
MNDIGLLIAMYGKETQYQLLTDKLGSKKGYIYENLIADILIKKGLKFYFYERTNDFEVDFVFSNENNIFLLEVKLNDGKPFSLIKIKDKKENKKCIAYKLHYGNVGVGSNYTSLPLYSLIFLV